MRFLFRDSMQSRQCEFVCVEEFAANHGMYFGTNCDLPDTVERGEMKQCFTNSSNQFVLHGGELAYVEGIAASESLGFPVHHAWLGDKEGNVYDPTWEYAPGEAHYFGVPFSDNYVFETMERTGYYGVISPTGMYNERLIKGIDKPEDFLHDWFKAQIISNK